jgi:two-component system, OmpR family, response regulator CpxR
MSVITLFSSIHCHLDQVRDQLHQNIGYTLLTDRDVVQRAAELSGIDAKRIGMAFKAKTSIFNHFTHEKERATAWLRLAVAEMLSQDKLIIDGFSGLLIPQTISHVLRICVIADLKSRLKWGQVEQDLSKKEILQKIRTADQDRMSWIEALFKRHDPWDPLLYDIVLPSDKTTPKETLALISENLRREVIQPTDASRRAAEDFILQAKVGVALAQEGHNVEVSARDGLVTITIHKNVLMLHHLEKELKSIAEKVEGVTSVETRIGKGFHKADIYRKFDFDMPKLLLVDDEREFVKTLSERLLMRDVHSATAYDGESALNILTEDEPEVMILDLKMPGIDGIEVLRKVKTTRPEVEVIILTGHGSEADRELCLSLGAFAYLQKPVDIDVLTETLKEANQKIGRLKKLY